LSLTDLLYFFMTQPKMSDSSVIYLIAENFFVVKLSSSSELI